MWSRQQAVLTFSVRFMLEFQYVARPLAGPEVQGRLVAANEQEVASLLAGRSLFAVRVQPVATKSARRRRIRSRDLTALYSQLADLLHAGVPLLRSLELLWQQTTHASLSFVLSDLHKKVANGACLSHAMATHPRVFPELVITVVRSGEEGGFLEEALKRIAGFTDYQDDLKSRVLGALAYPVFLIVTGALVVTGLLVFFVPNFAPIFERLREQDQLPLATSLLLGFSSFLRDYCVWIFLILLGSGGLMWRYVTSEKGRVQLDRWRIGMVGIGPIIRNLAIARVCRVLGTLLRNGVPILNALQIAKNATGNRVLTAAIAEAANRVSSGRSLVQPLAASGHFPREVIEMIAVGEKANRLEQILLDLADSLERRTTRQMDLLVRLLEPVMLLFMAAITVFLVAALLLPVFRTTSSLT